MTLLPLITLLGLLTPLPAAPKGALFASSAKLPPPLRQFRPQGLPGDGREPPLRILYPPNGSQIAPRWPS